MSELHYRCPHCQVAITVPQRAAGKTLPCPQCKGKAVVPMSLPIPDAEEWDFCQQQQKQRGPEPWYFGLAVSGGGVLIFFCLLWVCVTLVRLISLLSRITQNTSLTGGEKFEAILNQGGDLLFWHLFLGPLSLLLLSSLIYLNVDMARSLRFLKDRH